MRGVGRVVRDRKRRHRLLREVLDELTAIHGPVDEELVRTYTDLLV